MGKLKEYSYLLMLSTSILLVSGTYWSGLLPKSFFKDIQDDTVAREHMTLPETENVWEISELLDTAKSYLREFSINELKDILAEKILRNSINDESAFELSQDDKDDKTGSEREEEGGSPSDNFIKSEENSNSAPNQDTDVKEAYGSTEPIGNGAAGSREELIIRENSPASDKGQNGGEKNSFTEENTAMVNREPVFYKGESAYFEDALFIGDSRTEGLREYGGLGEATIISDSGLSIYRLWKDTFSVKDMGKVSFEEVLRTGNFKKVYLMLGINELGYDYTQTIKKYEEALRLIEETQPGATIFLMANLHVTDEKSQKSDIFNNENINRFNRALEALARKKKYIYLDVNPLFDDSNGNLSKEYTYDHAHILGVYYIDWVNWILEHCV